MIKKKIAICFSLFFIANCCFSQSNAQLLKQFDTLKNSVAIKDFVQAYSIFGYYDYELHKYFIDDKFETISDSLIFNTTLFNVIGPFNGDSVWLYLKLTQVDTGYYFTADNIFLTDSVVAKKATKRIKKKSSRYNDFCKTINKDNNASLHCSLGTFSQYAMVKEFTADLLKHRTGDIFLTKTQYGWHIVRLNKKEKNKRVKVNYVVLVLPKE